MAGTDLGTIVAHLNLDVNQFQNGVQQAQQQLENASSGFDRVANAGRRLQGIGAGLTAAVTVPVAGIAKSAYEVNNAFQTSMSNVQALSGATGKDLQDLTNLAREMGATTQFSASECADALGYMALAGWDAQQSMDGLPGVLNLAAASGMELADASDMVTDYLSAFGEGADQAGRMADVLAYAQAHSNTTTAGLGEAFKNCAANAHAFGLDIEQTTALIGKLSDQGLKGSEAGTALTAVMRDITQKMKNGKIQIGNTAVAVQDSNGNFRDMTDILGDVEKATNGMGDAQKNAALMGTFTADSIKALNILLNTGSGNIKDFEKALRGSKGSAEEMAKTMNDNLEGDLKSMNSAIEECYLTMMEKLDPVLRLIVQGITKLAQGFSKIPQPIMIVIMSIAGILAVLGPLLVIIGTVMTKAEKCVEVINRFRAFRQAGGFARIFSTALNGVRAACTRVVGVITNTVIPALQSLWAFLLANPIVLVIAAIVGLVAGFTYLWNHCEAFRAFWIKLWKDFLMAVQSFSPALAGVFKGIGNVISGFVNIIQALLGGIKDIFVDIFTGNFDKIPEDFAQMGEKLQDAINKIFDGLGQIAQNAMQALQDVFMSGLNTLFDPIINWGYSISGAFGDAMVDLYAVFKDGFDLILDYWRDVGSILKDLFSGDFEGALQGVQTLFSHLGENVLNVLQDLGTFVVDIFRSIGEGITNALASAWNSITSWFSQLGSSIMSILSNALSAIGDFFNNLPSMIGTAIGVIGGVIASGIVNAWNFVTQTVPTYFAQIGQWFSQLPSMIGQWLTDTYNRVTQWASQLPGKAQEAASRFVESASNYFTQLPSRVGNWLTQTYNRASQWASQLPAKAQQAGSRFVSRASSALSQLPGRIWSYLSSCISRAINFASQFASKGMQAANNFKNRILSGLRSIPSQVLGIGRQIVQGLWNGIKGAGGWLRSQISSFASSVVAGFKSSFKIHSPSGVMRDEVGKYLPKGIDVGIKLGSKDTLKAVRDFSNQIIETAKLGNISQALSVNTGDVSTQNIVQNDSTVAAIQGLERTIAQQKTEFDYNKLKDCFVSGASNIDSTILMDKEVVGKKVAAPVKTHNDTTTMRLNRLEGITQW